MNNRQNRKLFTRLLPLVLILTATLGAGIIDMVTEIVPIRPYSSIFSFTPAEMIGRSSSIMADILVVSLAVVLVASLIAAVANRTTGIIISHRKPRSLITDPTLPAILRVSRLDRYRGASAETRGRSLVDAFKETFSF